MIGASEANKMIRQIEATKLELESLKLEQKKVLNRLEILSAELERIREKLL